MESLVGNMPRHIYLRALAGWRILPPQCRVTVPCNTTVTRDPFVSDTERAMGITSAVLNLENILVGSLVRSASHRLSQIYVLRLGSGSHES